MLATPIGQQLAFTDLPKDILLSLCKFLPVDDVLLRLSCTCGRMASLLTGDEMWFLFYRRDFGSVSSRYPRRWRKRVAEGIEMWRDAYKRRWLCRAASRRRSRCSDADMNSVWIEFEDGEAAICGSPTWKKRQRQWMEPDWSGPCSPSTASGGSGEPSEWEIAAAGGRDTVPIDEELSIPCVIFRWRQAATAQILQPDSPEAWEALRERHKCSAALCTFDQPVPHLFMCTRSGLYHHCHGDCNLAVLTVEDDFVCPISGKQVSPGLLAQARFSNGSNSPFAMERDDEDVPAGYDGFEFGFFGKCFIAGYNCNTEDEFEAFQRTAFYH